MSKKKPAVAAAPKPHGIMAQFDTPAELLHACEAVSARGYVDCDAFTPFPVHGIDEALRIPGSKVPWVVLGGAVTGGSLALLMQWWMSAVDYPLRIAGKPFFSLPAFVPVIFELTILFSAFAAVFGMLGLNGLPKPYHPVFKHSNFARATDDKFFLIIEATDPRYDEATCRKVLSEAGGKHVEVVEE